MGEWISVKDRLPNNNQEVVAVTVRYYGGIEREKVVVCTKYEKERGFRFFEYDSYFVTHWMPLPPPPET